MLKYLYKLKLPYAIITVCCFNWLPWTSTGSSHWDVSWSQLNLENIEILYALSALKEIVQINCKKACSVMEQAECQHSADIFWKYF